MNIPIDEREVLAFNPFDGDFGTPGDRVLKDKLVTARKSGQCHMCAQEIQIGSRIRSRSDIFDGALMRYRWCEKCCLAMSASWTDNGDALTAREALRRNHDTAD